MVELEMIDLTVNVYFMFLELRARLKSRASLKRLFETANLSFETIFLSFHTAAGEPSGKLSRQRASFPRKT